MDKPKEKEDPEDIEKSLFAESDSSGSGEPEIGLLKKQPKKYSMEKSDNRYGGFDDKKITISFNPGTIGRFLFAVVFLFLLFSFFYNPFYNYFPWNKELPGAGSITGSTVMDADEADGEKTAETAGKEDKIEDKAKAENESAEEKEAGKAEGEELQESGGEAEANETESENKSMDTKKNGAANDTINDTIKAEDVIVVGDVILSIENIETSVKSWGGKIAKVSYNIENMQKDFVPKIRAYAYDTKTKPDFMKWPVIQTFDTVLEKGKRLKGSVDLSKFQFSDIKTPKTIEIKLFDEGEEKGYANDKLVATVMQDIEIKQAK